MIHVICICAIHSPGTYKESILPGFERLGGCEGQRVCAIGRDYTFAYITHASILEADDIFSTVGAYIFEVVECNHNLGYSSITIGGSGYTIVIKRYPTTTAATGGVEAYVDLVSVLPGDPTAGELHGRGIDGDEIFTFCHSG